MIRALLFAAILAQAGCSAVEPTFARSDSRWESQPPEIRQWFSSVMQPGNEYISCCGEGDAFEVSLDGEEPDGSLRTTVTNGKDVLPNGTLVIVPRNKIQIKYGNPLDAYIVFVSASNGKVLCFIPKVGV